MAFRPADKMTDAQKADYQAFVGAAYDEALELIKTQPTLEKKEGLSDPKEIEAYVQQRNEYLKKKQEWDGKVAQNPFYKQVVAELAKVQEETGTSNEVALTLLEKTSLPKLKDATYKQILEGKKEEAKESPFNVSGVMEGAQQSAADTFSLFSPSSWGAAISNFFSGLVDGVMNAFSKGIFNWLADGVKDLLVGSGNLDVAAQIKSFKSGFPELPDWVGSAKRLGGQKGNTWGGWINGKNKKLTPEQAKEALVQEQALGALGNGLEGEQRDAFVKQVTEAHKAYAQSLRIRQFAPKVFSSIDNELSCYHGQHSPAASEKAKALLEDINGNKSGQKPTEEQAEAWLKKRANFDILSSEQIGKLKQRIFALTDIANRGPAQPKAEEAAPEQRAEVTQLAATIGAQMSEAGVRAQIDPNGDKTVTPEEIKAHLEKAAPAAQIKDITVDELSFLAAKATEAMAKESQAPAK